MHERLSRLLEREARRSTGTTRVRTLPTRDASAASPRGSRPRAAAEHGFDPARAFVVGDHRSDVEMGRRIGARTFQVRTGHGMDEVAEAEPLADHVVDDLAEAARIVRDEVLAGAGR